MDQVLFKGGHSLEQYFHPTEVAVSLQSWCALVYPSPSPFIFVCNHIVATEFLFNCFWKGNYGGREGFMLAHGRGAGIRDGSCWDIRESVPWRGGASTQPPPPPPRPVEGPAVPAEASAKQAGGEIEAGEIPADLRANMSGNDISSAKSSGWDKAPVMAALLAKPVHRTTSFPSVPGLALGPPKLAKHPSEGALQGSEQPGTSKPVMSGKVKDPRTSDSGDVNVTRATEKTLDTDVRLEPRKVTSQNHSFRLEPRKAVPSVSASMSMEPQASATGLEGEVQKNASEAGPTLSSPSRNARLGANDTDASASCLSAAAKHQEPRRKRLGWGQGLARRSNFLQPTASLPSEQEDANKDAKEQTAPASGQAQVEADAKEKEDPTFDGKNAGGSEVAPGGAVDVVAVEAPHTCQGQKAGVCIGSTAAVLVAGASGPSGSTESPTPAAAPIEERAHPSPGNHKESCPDEAPVPQSFGLGDSETNHGVSGVAAEVQRTSAMPCGQNGLPTACGTDPTTLAPKSLKRKASSEIICSPQSGDSPDLTASKGLEPHSTHPAGPNAAANLKPTSSPARDPRRPDSFQPPSSPATKFLAAPRKSLNSTLPPPPPPLLSNSQGMQVDKIHIEEGHGAYPTGRAELDKAIQESSEAGFNSWKTEPDSDEAQKAPQAGQQRMESTGCEGTEPSKVAGLKERKAALFVRIEEVENDMEAIEKQLATARSDLEASQQAVKESEEQLQGVGPAPEAPELTDSDGDVSSMSEDDDGDESKLAEFRAGNESDQGELAGIQEQLELVRARLKDSEGSAQASREAHESALRAVEEKEEAIRNIPPPPPPEPPADASVIGRCAFVAAILEKNKWCAAVAESALHPMLPSSMVCPLDRKQESEQQNQSVGDGFNPYRKTVVPWHSSRVSDCEVYIRNKAQHKKMLQSKGLWDYLRRWHSGMQDKSLSLVKKYVQLRAREREMQASSGDDRGQGSPRLDQSHLTTEEKDAQVINKLQALERLKNMVKLPPQLIDEKEREARAIASDCGLVEDPVTELEAFKLANIWTPEERKIFVDKFQQFPKDFRRVASYLEHRSVGDCIQFFYENQKSDDFANYRRKKQLKKRKLYGEGSKKRGYMIAGAARQGGVVAQQRAREEADRRAKEEEKLAKAARARAERAALRENARAEAVAAAADAAFGVEDEERLLDALPQPVPAPRGPKEPLDRKTRDLLAVKPKKPKDKSKDKAHRPSAPQAGLDLQDGAGDIVVNAHWTEADQVAFLEAFREFGKDWKAIAAHVKTKTETACKSFFGKQRKRMGLDKLAPEHGSARIRHGAGDRPAAADDGATASAMDEAADGLVEGSGVRAGRSVSQNMESQAAYELAAIAAETQLLADETMDNSSPRHSPPKDSVPAVRAPPPRPSSTGATGRRTPRVRNDSEGAGRARQDHAHRHEDPRSDDVLAHLRAASASGLLPGFPDSVAAQFEQNLQYLRQQCPDSVPSGTGASSHMPNLPPGMSAAMQQLAMQQAGGMLGPQHLMQMGLPGMQGLLNQGGMLPPAMQAVMMQPGMMQLAGLQQLGLLAGMHGSTLGAGLGGAYGDAGGAASSLHQRTSSGGNLRREKQSSGQDVEGQSGKGARGSGPEDEAKLFGTDLRMLRHREQRRSEDDRGSQESHPSSSGDRGVGDREDGGEPDPSGALRSRKPGSPRRGSQKPQSGASRKQQQQTAARDSGAAAHGTFGSGFPGMMMGMGPNPFMPWTSEGADTDPSASAIPSSMAFAAMMRERLGAEGQRLGFEDMSSSERALLAALQQQQQQRPRMDGMGMWPDMRGIEAHPDIQRLLAGISKGSSSPSLRDLESWHMGGKSRGEGSPCPDRIPDGSENPTLQQLMQHQAALARMPFWPGSSFHQAEAAWRPASSATGSYDEREGPARSSQDGTSKAAEDKPRSSLPQRRRSSRRAEEANTGGERDARSGPAAGFGGFGWPAAAPPLGWGPGMGFPPGFQQPRGQNWPAPGQNGGAGGETSGRHEGQREGSGSASEAMSQQEMQEHLARYDLMMALAQGRPSMMPHHMPHLNPFGFGSGSLGLGNGLLPPMQQPPSEARGGRKSPTQAGQDPS